VWLRPTEWDTPDLYQLVAMGHELDAPSLAADHAKLAQFIREVTEREGLTINVDWVSEYKYEFYTVRKTSYVELKFYTL
jgi:hypothetical protein